MTTTNTSDRDIPQDELIALAKEAGFKCTKETRDCTFIFAGNYVINEKLHKFAQLIQQRGQIPDLNRRVEVEQVLLNVAGGKRGLLTPEECKSLAMNLGVPEWFRERK